MKALWIVLLLGVCPVLCASADTPRHPEELSLDALEFSYPRAQQHQLACGIPVYIHENHELPLLSVEIRFRMGKHFLPEDQFTTCDLLSRLWDSGGTRNIAPDSLERRLAQLDLTLSASIGALMGTVSAYMVSSDMLEGLPLWRDLLLYPGLDEERLQRPKEQALKDLREINNNPNWIADLRFEDLALMRQ